MRPIESRLARLMARGSVLAVGLLAIGIALMVARGISPLDAAPSLDPGRLVADLAALHPAGYLWLGAIAILGLPIARLALSVVVFAGSGERRSAIVGLATLTVILGGVVVGLAGRG